MSLPPLYKYLDVRGAKLSLTNLTFKHSKPSDFNDREDLTVQSIFPEDAELALTRIVTGLTDVILKNLDQQPTCPSPLREQLAVLQDCYRKDPSAANFVKEEIQKDPKVNELYSDQLNGTFNSFIDEINEFMQGYRVFCVSTMRCSDRLWNEYAQCHEGIAVRLLPCVAKDSKFQLFRPVEYKATRPPLYADPIEFLSDSLFGDQESIKRTMIERIIYSKSLSGSFLNHRNHL